ncbi:DUF4388 domain-containing protein [Hyalangium gracile]|uniref:DUF4388 domain-containing protein n=1 Tax=Hyalangium gracile TaxID=394092 RepID=UPI001CCCA341|nr:DUF4388 domain-containing protein [Hyalangium gracile]
MKTILVVTADTSVKAAVASAFRIHCDEFSVLTVTEAPKALSVMETRKVDLLLTAQSIPVLDDFQLLVYLLNRRPRVPVMVMSSRRRRGRASSKVPSEIPYLPLSLEGDELVSRIRTCLEERVRAQLPSVTLPSLLQVLHQEHATCRLLVCRENQRGKLYVHSGELVHARCGRLEGDRALLQILGWQWPQLLLLGQPRDVLQSISVRTSQLLGLFASDGARATPAQSAPAQRKSLPQTYEPPPGPDTFESARQTRPWTDHANRRLNWWDRKPGTRWMWWAVPDKTQSE